MTNFELPGNIFYELLFMPNSVVPKVAQYINGLSSYFFSLFFLSGAIVEYLGQHDYRGLLQRAIIASMVLASFETVLFQGVQHSFIFSEGVMEKFNGNNPLIIHLKTFNEKNRAKLLKKRTRGREVTLWDKLSVITKTLVSDTIVILLWIFTYICFTLLQNIYSTTFYLLYVFVSVMALLSLIKITSTPIKLAFITYLILLFQPLVMVVILIIMGGHSEFLTNGNGTLVENLRSLIQLLMTSVLLLFSPAFTLAIVNSGGIHAVSNKIAKVGAGALMISGLNAITKTAVNVTKGKSRVGKSILFGMGGLLGKPVKGLGSMMASKLHHKSNAIKEKAGFEPTYKDLQEELGVPTNKDGRSSNTLGSPISNTNPKKKRFQRGMENTSFGEKAIIVGDFVTNRKRIKIAENNRKEFVRNQGQGEIPSYQTLPIKDFSQKKSGTTTRNNKPQQIIAGLNSGDGRLADYSHEDKSTAVHLARKSKSSLSRTWIKDKQLYWMLSNEVLKEENAFKSLKRKAKKNDRNRK